MSSLEKRKLKKGFTYILRFRDQNGKQHSNSLKTIDLKVARRIQVQVDSKLAKRRWNLEKSIKIISLNEFTKIYIDQYSIVNKAPRTVAMDKLALRRLREYTGDKRLSDISPEQMESFKSERIQTVSPVTLNIELRCLKAAFNKAVEWDYIKINPLHKVKQLKVPNSNLPKFVNIVQMQQFFNCIHNKIHLTLFSFYAGTGCRRTEALELKWNDIDFSNDTVLFQKTKGGKARVVPLRSKLKSLLLDLPHQSDYLFPLESGYVSKLFKKYARKAELPDELTLHSLRHSFLTYAVSTSKNLRGAQSLAGHSSVKVTEIYTHLLADDLRDIVEGLPY